MISFFKGTAAEITAFRLMNKHKITEIPVKPGLNGLKAGYAPVSNTNFKIVWSNNPSNPRDIAA